MEFILGQQAQFNANIQKHDERLARNEELIGQIGEHMIQLEDVVNRLAAVTLAGFKDVNAKIDVLVDSHIRLSDSHAQLADAQARTEEAHKRLAEAQGRTDEAQKRTEEALARLSESQSRREETLDRLAEAQARTEANQALTEEALRRLIATVERQISEGRDGR
jgi:F0F1-type ATP synthase epsilon subunit